MIRKIEVGISNQGTVESHLAGHLWETGSASVRMGLAVITEIHGSNVVLCLYYTYTQQLLQLLWIYVMFIEEDPSRNDYKFYVKP